MTDKLPELINSRPHYGWSKESVRAREQYFILELKGILREFKAHNNRKGRWRAEELIEELEKGQ